VLCVRTRAVGARAAAARTSYAWSETRTGWQAPKLMGGAASQFGLPSKPYQSVSLLAACRFRRWRYSLPTLSISSWSTFLNNVSTCIPINYIVCIPPGCECIHIWIVIRIVEYTVAWLLQCFLASTTLPPHTRSSTTHLLIPNTLTHKQTQIHISCDKKTYTKHYKHTQTHNHAHVHFHNTRAHTHAASPLSACRCLFPRPRPWPLLITTAGMLTCCFLPKTSFPLHAAIVVLLHLALQLHFLNSKVVYKDIVSMKIYVYIWGAKQYGGGCL